MDVRPGPRIPETPVPQPERGAVSVEQRTEHQPQPRPTPAEVQPVDLPTPQPVVLDAQPANPTTAQVQQVEEVMADGLGDAYAAMSPTEQQEFKRVGESTAAAIIEVLTSAKAQVQKVVTLILRWLRLIPNVNPYYLEQQARIKADAIINLKLPPRQDA